ncbi:MAG: hypothetical protein PUG60_01935 [Lachnospiraceae bacterium]|nr:hypothetical protein [Lachnospiraceae bacterium]MDY4971039.1 hypothetical protein [Lachnospiraceae bacterium]
MSSRYSDSVPDGTPDVKTEELKEACDQCGGHHELDTSQGDFTTIAAGILLALAVYAIIPAVTGIRLGDYPTVIIYGGFLVLVVLFWFIAEKVKEHHRRKN